jgi:hypothetical protein
MKSESSSPRLIRRARGEDRDDGDPFGSCANAEWSSIHMR